MLLFQMSNLFPLLYPKDREIKSTSPAGCIKVKGIGFSPKVSAKGSALVQPERIGGHTIFESNQVVVDIPLSRIVTGMVSPLTSQLGITARQLAYYQIWI